MTEGLNITVSQIESSLAYFTTKKFGQENKLIYSNSLREMLLILWAYIQHINPHIHSHMFKHTLGCTVSTWGVHYPLLQTWCLCDIPALPAALSLKKQTTDVLVLVHTNNNYYFAFLVWFKEFRFKALHTHSVAQCSAKHLGRAGPVWQMLYNQNAN